MRECVQDAQPRLDDSGLRWQGIGYTGEILGGAILCYLMFVGGILASSYVVASALVLE